MNKRESEQLKLGLLTQALNDPDKLKEAIEARQALSRARQEAKAAQQPAPAVATTVQTAGKVVKLPPWAGELRVCPSCVLRSALFGVVERGRRKYLERQVIAAWPDAAIRYTGGKLDQSDLDVWLTVLHIAREQTLGVQVSVTTHGLLKAMGRCTGKRDHEWLQGVLARLTACAVEIIVGCKSYMGPLIQGVYRDEETGRYVLILNPDLVVLFEDNAFTRLEWEQRQGLHKDLAKWLHGYILSHQATAKHPHRIGLERLRELCGSDIERLGDFRKEVRAAMKELKDASVVTAWRITENDALEVVRPPQKPQLLEGKKSRRARDSAPDGTG